MLTIGEIKRRIAPVCQRYHIRAAYLFGSYARGEAREESDVDIRVDDGGSPYLRGLFQLSGFRLDLVEALGKEVDLLAGLPTGPLAEGIIKELRRDEVLVYGPVVKGPVA